jgi:hypothetical protein
MNIRKCGITLHAANGVGLWIHGIKDAFKFGANKVVKDGFTDGAGLLRGADDSHGPGT